MNKTFDSEMLSGIAYRLNNYMDNTATLLYSGDISTGVTKTGTIVDLSRYSENWLYVDHTCLVAAAGATTGVRADFYVRPTSGSPWVLIAANSNMTSGAFAQKVIGSGIASSSGLTFIKDLKTLFTNVASSGTAVISAYIMSK